jgi:hypothetical protein
MAELNALSLSMETKTELLAMKSMIDAELEARSRMKGVRRVVATMANRGDTLGGYYSMGIDGPGRVELVEPYHIEVALYFDLENDRQLMFREFPPLGIEQPA